MPQLLQVLHMNGGDGDSSYANNSLLQKKVISMTKPIRDKAVNELYCRKFLPKLAIADLGCSSGPNTLLVVSQFITMMDNICKTLGSKLPEIQVFLNDLPGNDFNTVFKSLPNFQEKLGTILGPGAGHCYFSGVPGSFYGRLFPNKSLHFLHSSYSLHWLSQVPPKLENNKEDICVSTTSPPSMLQAYHQQFQRDFSFFLKCRSKELMEGGCMVLTLLGRKYEDNLSENSSYIFELLAVALNEMVSEGKIEKERLDSFYLPHYTPSPAEVKAEVLKEGSFAVDCLEISEVNWNVYDDQIEANSDKWNNSGYKVAKYMRAVVESLIVSHFGETIINELFDRYSDIITDRMSKEKTAFINVTLSIIKLGD